MLDALKVLIKVGTFEGRFNEVEKAQRIIPLGTLNGHRVLTSFDEFFVKQAFSSPAMNHKAFFDTVIGQAFFGHIRHQENTNGAEYERYKHLTNEILSLLSSGQRHAFGERMTAAFDRLTSQRTRLMCLHSHLRAVVVTGLLDFFFDADLPEHLRRVIMGAVDTIDQSIKLNRFMDDKRLRAFTDSVAMALEQNASHAALAPLMTMCRTQEERGDLVLVLCSVFLASTTIQVSDLVAHALLECRAKSGLGRAAFADLDTAVFFSDKTCAAFLKETLRIFPLNPFLARECTEDCVVNDTPLRAGDVLVISLRALQTHAIGTEFSFQRFDGRGGDLPYWYAFGYGERRCPGQNLGLMLACALLQHIDGTWRVAICRKAVHTRSLWRFYGTLLWRKDADVRPHEGLSVRLERAVRAIFRNATHTLVEQLTQIYLFVLALKKTPRVPVAVESSK
jgi:hypothetical protein